MSTLQQDMNRLACCHKGSILNPVIETTAQQRFNAIYINSVAIAEQLGVSRAAVMGARKRGLLPDPIVVNDSQIYIWERETVAPYVEAWHNALKLRRGQPLVIPLMRAGLTYENGKPVVDAEPVTATCSPLGYVAHSLGALVNKLTSCAAHQDGECYHAQCPQLRDKEPATSGRHCPLDTYDGGE